MNEAILKEMSAVPETLGRSQWARATPGWAAEGTRQEPPATEQLSAWLCFPSAVPVLQPRNNAYLVVDRTTHAWARPP